MKITYPTSVLAKEKGIKYKPFDPIFNYFLPDSTLMTELNFHRDFLKYCYPIFHQDALAKRLREEYKIFITIEFYDNSTLFEPNFSVTVFSYPNYLHDYDFYKDGFGSYESAFEWGLQMGLKLIKE